MTNVVYCSCLHLYKLVTGVDVKLNLYDEYYPPFFAGTEKGIHPMYIQAEF